MIRLEYWNLLLCLLLVFLKLMEKVSRLFILVLCSRFISRFELILLESSMLILWVVCWWIVIVLWRLLRMCFC